VERLTRRSVRKIEDDDANRRDEGEDDPRGRALNELSASVYVNLVDKERRRTSHDGQRERKGDLAEESHTLTLGRRPASATSLSW
jgi:hypothetical protein